MRLYTGGEWVEVAGVVLPDGSVSCYPQNFDADYATKGTGGYRAPIVNGGGGNAAVVDDPVLGASRQVLQLATDDTPLADGKVRVQAEGPFVFGPGHDLWVGFGVHLPASVPAVPADGWFILHEVHGPPFAGGSPNALALDSSDRLTFGDGKWTTPLTRGQWYDFALRLRLSRSPLRGFAELWMNTGAGWVQQTFDTGSTRRHYATLGAANSDGFNGVQAKHYRKTGMAGWAGSVAIHFAEHRVGSSFAQVAPTSHP